MHVPPIGLWHGICQQALREGCIKDSSKVKLHLLMMSALEIGMIDELEK